MSNISFTGLSSGFDTTSLVNQLIQLERIPVSRLQAKQNTISQKKGAFESFESLLKTLNSSAKTLADETAFKAFQASVGQNSVLTVSIDNDAAAGSYEVDVTQLAKAQQDYLVSSSGALPSDPSDDVGFTSKTDALSLTGTLDITIDSTTFQISVDSTDTLEMIRNKINSDTDVNSGVTASILSVNDTDHRLVISSNDTGVNPGVTVTNNLTGTSGLTAVAGQDAQLDINGITVNHSSNTVTGVIQGLTLNLLNTNANTGDGTLTISVDRNDGMIESTAQSFVDSYNAVRSFINKQFTFDTETTVAGLLFGDSTLRSIQTQLQRVLGNTVTGLTGSYDTLVDLGITVDRKGLLSIDSEKFREALQASNSQVADVFIGQGTASDSDITFVGFTDETKAGTYNVNITTAPEQAVVTGTQDLSAGIALDETLTITDTAANVSADIALTSGDDITSIVNKINAALETKIAEVHTSDTANTASSSPITASTTFGDIDGAGVVNGDTITISGKTRNGSSVSNTYTISDTSTTMQDFLNAIESTFNGEVSATIDGNGKLVVTDDTAGFSQLSFTLTENNQGGGSLNFGNLTESTQGRNAIRITASNDGSNRLKLNHEDYGAAIGFSVTSTDTQILGTASDSDTGVDVAGTINGEAATGNGRILIGDAGNSNTDRLSILVNDNATGAQGTVSLTLGIAEQMDGLLKGLTDSIDGMLAIKQDALQGQHDAIQDRIDRIEARLLLFEERLRRQFLAMEQAMSRIQSQGNFLLAQLGAGFGIN